MPARPAATIIVLRELDAGASALMVRRNPALRFFGGYWVFPGGAIDPADARSDDSAIVAAARAACRELREEAGLEVEPGGLVHWARWITPSAVTKRYDTQFFVGAAPANQEPRVAEGEVTALDWLPVARWPQLSETGAFPVPAPTQLVLREVSEALERHGSVADLLRAERDRTIHCVLPKMIDGERIVLPWDPEYDAVPGEGASWTREGIEARRHWPARV